MLKKRSMGNWRLRAEAWRKQHFIQRRKFLARKVIALDLKQSPKSPEGEKILRYILSLYFLLIEMLWTVATASGISQGRIYVLRSCLCCTLQKTSSQTVRYILHHFLFYDLQNKLGYFASNSTGYLLRERVRQENTCRCTRVMKQLLHGRTNKLVCSWSPIWQQNA
jgi:hypothetical protein